MLTSLAQPLCWAVFSYRSGLICTSNDKDDNDDDDADNDHDDYDNSNSKDDEGVGGEILTTKTTASTITKAMIIDKDANDNE